MTKDMALSGAASPQSSYVKSSDQGINFAAAQDIGNNRKPAFSDTLRTHEVTLRRQKLDQNITRSSHKIYFAPLSCKCCQALPRSKPPTKDSSMASKKLRRFCRGVSLMAITT